MAYISAMATLPVQLDEQELLMQQLAAEVKLPRGVRFERVVPYTEWTGEDAFRFYFSVSKDIPLTRKRARELNSVRTAVEERVLPLGLGKWPFVEFIDPPRGKGSKK